MKWKRKIAWLLCLIMAFSFAVGNVPMQAYAGQGDGETFTINVKDITELTGDNANKVYYSINDSSFEGGYADMTWNSVTSGNPISITGDADKTITIKTVTSGTDVNVRTMDDAGEEHWSVVPSDKKLGYANFDLSSGQSYNLDIGFYIDPIEITEIKIDDATMTYTAEKSPVSGAKVSEVNGSVENKGQVADLVESWTSLSNGDGDTVQKWTSEDVSSTFKFDNTHIYNYQMNLTADVCSVFKYPSVWVNGERIYGTSTGNDKTTLSLTSVKTLNCKDTYIYNVDLPCIEGAAVSANPGDAPRAITAVPDTANYVVTQETWEDTPYGNIFWQSDHPEYANLTTFENGKEYCYQLSLKAKEGYQFADNVQVSLAGTPLNIGVQVTNRVDDSGFTSKVLCKSASFTVGNSTPSGQNYSVNFGTGSWTVNGTNVTANKTGTQTLTASDEITLTGFDAATMDAKLTAEDGFSTKLTVTNGKTSISTKDCANLPNGTMTFSVVAKSAAPQPGGDTPSGGGSAAKQEYDADTGVQFYTRNGSTGQWTVATQLPYLEGLTLNGNSLSAYATYDAAKQAFVITKGGKTGGDNVLAFQEPFGVKITNVWCGDTVSDATKCAGTGEPGNGVRYSISKPYAELYKVYIEYGVSDDVTIVWTYDESHKNDTTGTWAGAYVEHGTVSIDQVMRNGSPVTYTDQDSNEKNHHVMLKRGDVVTLRLVPDYGYQLQSVNINGTQAVAGEKVSTFTVTMDNNLHFQGIFVKANDKVDTSQAKTVSNVSIENGGNAAASGNLSMKVADAALDSNVTSTYGKAVSTVDIGLQNIVSKGTEGAYWTSNITEFKDPIKVTLQLDKTAYTSGDYTVVRNHNGVLTNLNAKYDANTGTISFETNQFSSYTIVEKYAGTSGWVQDGDTWYYMNSSGAMETGWEKVNNTWYYMNGSGAMQTGWVLDGGKWYYMDGNGSMATGWRLVNGKWYYMNSNGSMATGWRLVNGKWYYMNSNGSMATGWILYNGKWYYLNESGAMLTGWYQVNGKWYYSYEDGSMAASTRIGKYRVNANGEWVK